MDKAALLAEAKENYRRGYERDKDNIEAGYDDLKFLDGEGQWDSSIREERKRDDRPCITVNVLPQFVRQITGDMRMNKPAIKVTPVDDEAVAAKADKIYGGMIRYIENRSIAQAAYSRATDFQVGAGIGYLKVTTEYADDGTANKEIAITKIDDPISVICDPDAVDPARRDAKWFHAPVDMSKATFKAKWPEAKVEDFSGDEVKDAEGWYTEDYIRVSEYWFKKPVKRTISIVEDVEQDITDIPDDAKKEIRDLAGRMGGRIEEITSFEVYCCLMTCAEILEGPTLWPGKYIPLIPVIGDETQIGRKIIRKGVIRNAKGAQQLFNYALSAQAETVGLQPKAPFLGTKKNFEKHKKEWGEANRKNLAFLEYTPDPLNGNAPPSRVQPAVSSQGVTEMITLAQANIKAVIGIYDAGLGARSNETSGRAIIARQREGDVGTFLFPDNFAVALHHLGTVIVDLIPKIYDTQRVIRVIGDDGKSQTMTINQVNSDMAVEQILNDVTVGKYDVYLDSGPSFTTKRDEQREVLSAFIQGNPAAAPIIMDKVVGTLDLPDSDVLSKRFHAMLPPQIQKLEDQEAQGQTAAPGMPQQAPEPSPDEIRAEQGKDIEFQVATEKAKAEVAEANAKARQAEANAQKAETELQIKLVELEKAKRDFLNPPTQQELAQPQ